MANFPKAKTTLHLERSQCLKVKLLHLKRVIQKGLSHRKLFSEVTRKIN